MKPIAFLGLGKIGSPMVKNLCSSGFLVNAYSRSGVPPDLVAAGVTECATIASAVAGVDYVALSLPTTEALEDVLSQPGGVFESASRGATIIVLSSVKPHDARVLHDKANAVGLQMIDAPVSGGVEGALAGQLSVMVGGDHKVLANALPVLEAVAQTVVHVGGPGSGHLVKAANQLMVAMNLIGVAEALVFLEQPGVDLESAIVAMEGGSAASRMLSDKARRMMDGDFTPGFRLSLHHRDVLTALEEVHDARVVLPMSSLAADLIGRAASEGNGEFDHSVVHATVKKAART